MKRRSKVGGQRPKLQRQNASKLKYRSAVNAPRRPSSAGRQEEKIVRLTRELDETREQQAATSEVLRALSQTEFQLQSVLQSVAENAARLCRSDGAVIFQLQDGVYRFAAGYSLLPEFLEIERRALISPGSGTLIGRAAMTQRVERIDDALTDPLYEKKEDAKVEGNRSMIGVPLMRGGEPVVVIGMGRRRVDPFGEREIELAKSFAAQAVIAIENARLLNDLRQRTTDLTERTAELTEALEQQTATSEVLKVISSSPGELQPAFDAMLDKAVRICRADAASLFLYENGVLRRAARHSGVADAILPIAPSAKSGTMRSIATKQVVHIANYLEEPAYIEGDDYVVAAAERLGLRASLHVPMFREQEVIGVFTIWRTEARAFTTKQIELVTNFANQAVIAIENARLLNELRQSLEQQTATAEVLGVISRSRFELQPVLQSVVDTATLLCRAKLSGMWRLEGGRYRLAAASGRLDPAYRETQQQASISPGLGTLVGRAAMKREVVQIEDAWSDPLYEEKENAKLGGVRSMIGVPLMREGEPIGVFGLARTQVEPFVEREIELVRTFADQAVIAIENARLLNELRERTDQLQSQSQELAKLNQKLEQRVADQVGEIERMSRLRRFLPPQVADLIVASGSEKQLESHRREITALFCDLRGFTGFTESADAEDVMALLRDYHAAIGEIIIKYNGTLERYAGDGVMVVFNDPVPVENPALQAVLMALEVRVAIGELTDKWRRLGHDIGFGIGIAHGFATLGTIGFEGRFDYAAIGTVSNVASRLCDEAKPGQILISPRVLMAVEDTVTVEPVGEFELKGIRRPLAAYNVVAAGRKA